MIYLFDILNKLINKKGVSVKPRCEGNNTDCVHLKRIEGPTDKPILWGEGDTAYTETPEEVEDRKRKY